MITDQLITLPGLGSDYPVTLTYNSTVFGSSTPSAVTNDTGSGWAITGFDQRLVSNSDGSVTYYGPGGLTGVFTSDGAGGYVAPTQFAATLTGSKTAGWQLVDHSSQESLVFNTSGRLTSDSDRNGNRTTIARDSNGFPSQITSTRGLAIGRRLSFTTTNGQITGISQSQGSGPVRTLSFGYSANGHLASVTDPNGGVTHFASASGTDTGEVSSITNPDGNVTTLGLSAGKVTQVIQQNSAYYGGAGQSTTRISYASASQTLVADPTTNQSLSVSAVPHSTYNLTTNGTMLVAQAIDADGNQRSTTYTSLNNVSSSTPAAGGATTYSYNANNGESLTSVASSTGASQSATYNNTGTNAYLPSSTTNDAGNSTQLTYDNNGNQLSSQVGTNAPSANVTYNANGTVATSASPGAASGVVTTYTYDANNNLQEIDPPSGTSLGHRTYTWDGFGRLATATDGAGNTATYSYDSLDRITGIAYSDSTPSITYTYNNYGQVTQRVDGAATTTYAYDPLGHLVSTHNTLNGNTVSYTYDLAGALLTSTDSNGTVTYNYDNAHLLTSMNYPDSSGTQTTLFQNDANGRRTDVWMQSNSTHTSWAAHEHFSYDSAGRVTGALGQNGPASSPVTVLNETLCYSAGAVAPSCPSTSSADRNNIQWTSDTVSGETNTYQYDSSNRLTSDVVTGGTNPRSYTFHYDSAGNRTTAQVTGSSPASQALSFNAANQISSSGYTYDGAGNQTLSPTRSATFDAAGQQLTAQTGSQHITYTWDGPNENELVRRVNPAEDTYTYTYGRPDSSGIPTIDSIKIDNNTGYVLSDPSGVPVMLMTNTGKNCLYMYDGTGNPVALSTSLSVTGLALHFDPYGASTRLDSNGVNGPFVTNPYGFGRGVVDPDTHEVRFGQRYYSPVTGTWLQQDAVNTPLDPANANRYEYAGDNPIDGSDPTGRLDILDLAEECGEGAAEGLFTGIFTGQDETGVGAIEAAIQGCGADAIANFLEQEGYDSAAQEVKTADSAKAIADVIAHIVTS